MKQPWQLSHLQSGGIIVTYRCMSRCRHCLYNCAPQREDRYITPDTMRTLLQACRRLGCPSVHIGGGEPFIEPKMLLKVLEVAAQEKIGIDYIETNSGWFMDGAWALPLLKEVRKLGVATILLSISPFHNEYIPFKRIDGLRKACAEAELAVYPWVDGFWKDLRVFDPEKPHRFEEYIKRFGDGYPSTIPQRYWIYPGGRGLAFLADFSLRRKAEDIAAGASACEELSDTSHFHLDLDGNYIPGLCTGLSFSHELLGSDRPDPEHPFLEILFREGVGGLLKLAREQHGFKPKSSYFHKCDLCSDIRSFLVLERAMRSKDLQPREFYMYF